METLVLERWGREFLIFCQVGDVHAKEWHAEAVGEVVATTPKRYSGKGRT